MSEKQKNKPTIIYLESNLGRLAVVVCGCGSLIYEPALDRHTNVCPIMGVVMGMIVEEAHDA